MKYIKKVLWVQILFLLFSFAIVSNLHPWTTPFRVSQNEWSLTAMYPSIFIDKYNHIYVTWDNDFTGNAEIYYRYCEGANPTVWSPIINISNDTIDSYLSDVVVDSKGRPHIVWNSLSSYEIDIRWSYLKDGSWTTPVNLSNLPGWSSSPTIVSDTVHNKLHLVWQDDFPGNFELYYKCYNVNEEVWSDTQRITNSPSGDAFPDMDIDSNGNLHFVWRYQDDLDIYYSFYNDTFWSTPIDISNLPGGTDDPAIAITPDGTPHVVWEQELQIYYTTRIDSFWRIPISIFPHGNIPDIGIDSNGRILTACGQGPQILCRFFEDSIGWSPIETLDTHGQSPNISVQYDTLFNIIWSKIQLPRGWVYYSREYNPPGVFETKEKISSFIYCRNYPEPFFSFTNIKFVLTMDTDVSLLISNICGRVLRIYRLGRLQRGEHTFLLQPDTIKGGELPSGIYFFTLRGCDDIYTRKMTLIK